MQGSPGILPRAALFLLYINDIPFISNFDITLFADDTCLVMTDKNLKNLERKAQIELKKINSWLHQNNIFSKTNYMITNKQLLKTCQCNFGIAFNDIAINRAHTVKYLGLFIDGNPKWMSQKIICPCSLPDARGSFTDCAILLQGKPFA